MGLRDEIESLYTDEDGLILERPNSSPGPDTGNGIHNLSIYGLLLHLSGDLTGADLLKFIKVIDSCRVNSYAADYPPQPIKGLYNRGPRKPGDLIAHDDYICLSGASNIIGLPYATDIALYGMSHLWSFNNVDPGKWTFQSFQGRRLWLIPYWKMNGGFACSWLGRKALSLYICDRRHEADAGQRILDWFLARSMSGRTDDLTQAARVWKSGLLDVNAMGMRTVFTAYYGASHPFAKYAPLY